ncbi:hypothetical protein ACEE77_11580 [Staphylococcus simulans]
MRKLAMSILFCLSIFVLASCNQNGLEKISFKEAEKKLEDTNGEYIAFIDEDDNKLDEHKKILERAAEDNKIYYVVLTSETTTSDYYLSNFTAKYPHTQNGLFITNKGKEIDEKKVFDFHENLDIDDYKNSDQKLEEATDSVNRFLNEQG